MPANIKTLVALTGQSLDTTANWTTVNPVLPLGVFGIEKTVTNSYKLKVGDGETAWNSLAYLTTGSDGSSDMSSEEGTLTASTDIITTTKLFDPVAKKIMVFLGGIKQAQSTITCIDSTHIKVGTAFSYDTPYEVIFL